MKRIREAFIKLGAWMLQDGEEQSAMVELASLKNPWFTPINVNNALKSIASEFLNAEKLDVWLSRYPQTHPAEPKRVALILAGNIPLVGFHDFLCVMLSGHHATVKLSDRDNVLLPLLVKKLTDWEPSFSNKVNFDERLSDFDVVIATGSNQSSRYFDRYFGKYPHIIRKNRNAVAVLSGVESPEDLYKLGDDVFSYFGLGCRNVSKLYVPSGYDFAPLLQSFDRFRAIANHNKYRNNFDYNLATYMINIQPYMANECIILIESPDITSRISVLIYEYYQDLEVLERQLLARGEEIQCIVGNKGLLGVSTVGFGDAQKPLLWDYADGVDTMKFLQDL